MCYVSAEGRSREARGEEVLVVMRQPHGTNWLVSPDDSSTPVCLREGTGVELLYIPDDTQRRYRVSREANATFKMNDWWRRDVFALQNGRKAPLQKLQSGQVIRVLSVAELEPKKHTLGEQEPDATIEAQSIRRHLFKRTPSGTPVHWCL
jgi:hypothetical protein